MRRLQIALLIAGLVSFMAALFFVGKDTGDVLWRVGVGVTLWDMVCIMLWPSSSQA